MIQVATQVADGAPLQGKTQSGGLNILRQEKILWVVALKIIHVIKYVETGATIYLTFSLL